MDVQNKLAKDEFYHFYNRANSSSDKLFFQTRNYLYFLAKWDQYLGSYFEVWAYCLIPNHFHFLLKCLTDNNKEAKERLRRFSIGYTQAINRQQSRRGSLMQEHPKFQRVKEDAHLLSLIRYINLNAVHHRLTDTPKDWRFSSYGALSSSAPTKLARAEVIGLFGTIDNFLAFHNEKDNLSDLEYLKLDS